MADVYYIQVVEEEGSEAIELPLEEDQTLDLATLQSQFPNAIGLKYKAETGAWRGLKVNSQTITHPGKQWSDSIVYVVVFSKDNKRKAEAEDSGETPRTKSKISTTTSDLVVLNMPYDITEDDMKVYFGKFGETVLIQLKKKPDGSSRGFGFIRFKELSDMKLCLAQKHTMGDRILEVKIPQSKAAGFDDMAEGGERQSRHLSRRIHVGNVTSRVARKDLEEYFSQFGTITDIFIPKPTDLRKNPMYAFLTFSENRHAEAVINSDQLHKVNGENLTVGYASPINKEKQEALKTGQIGKGRGGNQPTFPNMMENFMGSADQGAAGGKPKNKMEAMGMAMAMMKQWMDTQDDDDQRGHQGNQGIRGAYPGSDKGGGLAAGYGAGHPGAAGNGGYAQGGYGGYGGYGNYGSYERPQGPGGRY